MAGAFYSFTLRAFVNQPDKKRHSSCFSNGDISINIERWRLWLDLNYLSHTFKISALKHDFNISANQDGEGLYDIHTRMFKSNLPKMIADTPNRLVT